MARLLGLVAMAVLVGGCAGRSETTVGQRREVVQEDRVSRVQRDAAMAMADAAHRLAAVWPGEWGPASGVLLVAGTTGTALP